MRRSAVLRLREVAWEPVLDGEGNGIGFEVGIRASAANVLGSDPESVCRDLFVDFRGYTEDDGTPVPNTLEARLELWSVIYVQGAVSRAAVRAQTELIQGEAVAVSG